MDDERDDILDELREAHRLSRCEETATIFSDAQRRDQADGEAGS